jgi:hypothetical protein
MKRLLTLTAIIEATTGLALLVMPSFVVRLLLGSPLETFDAVTLGRVAGSGLLALGVACWLARNDTESSATTGLVVAMLLYNLFVAIVLGGAGVSSHPIGIALWPAVALHAAMFGWCVVSL